MLLARWTSPSSLEHRAPQCEGREVEHSITFRAARRHAGVAAIALAAITTIVLGAPNAKAQTAQEAIALRSFEDGRRLYEARAYEEALRAFQTSLEAMPSPNTRLYVARCFREKGLVASAFTTFRIASREAEDRVRATGDKRYAATQRSAAIEAEQLDALVPRVTFVLEPAPDARETDLQHAVVELDGTPFPRSRLSEAVELDPGAHTLSVKGAHVRARSMEVAVAPRESKRVVVPVERVPFGTVRLTLTSMPRGLAAELDGEPIDMSVPVQMREVSVGSHRVVARAPGYATARWEGPVADAAVVEVPIVLSPAPIGAGAMSTPEQSGGSGGTPKWLFFGAAGGAIAFAGAGAILLADARATDAEESSKPQGTRDPEVRDDVRTRAQIGSALLVGGGAFAVTAVVLALTTKWKASTALAPLSRAVARGAMIGGEF